MSLENLHKLLCGKNDYCNFKKRFIKKDGSIIWINVIATLLKDLKGQPVHFIAHFIDITESKRSELALLKSEERFSKIFSKNLAPLTLTRLLDRKIIEANDAYCQLIEYDHEDIVEHTAVELGVTDQKMCEKIMDEVQTKGFVRNTEMLIRTKNGNERNIFYTSEPIEIGDEQFLLSISIDITERKKVEEALKQSEERYRQLYDNFTLGIYRTTPDGRLLLANPALLKMLNYSSFEEITERNSVKKGTEPFYNRKKFIEQIETAGEVKGLESIWMCNDGTIIYVRENARVIRDFSGKSIFYDGIVENITERKLAEEQNIRNEHLLRLFVEHSPGIHCHV